MMREIPQVVVALIALLYCVVACTGPTDKNEGIAQLIVVLDSNTTVEELAAELQIELPSNTDGNSWVIDYQGRQLLVVTEGKQVVRLDIHFEHANSITLSELERAAGPMQISRRSLDSTAVAMKALDDRHSIRMLATLWGSNPAPATPVKRFSVRLVANE